MVFEKNNHNKRQTHLVNLHGAGLGVVRFILTLIVIALVTLGGLLFATLILAVISIGALEQRRLESQRDSLLLLVHLHDLGPDVIARGKQVLEVFAFGLSGVVRVRESGKVALADPHKHSQVSHGRDDSHHLHVNFQIVQSQLPVKEMKKKRGIREGGNANARNVSFVLELSGAGLQGECDLAIFNPKLRDTAVSKNIIESEVNLKSDVRIRPMISFPLGQIFFITSTGCFLFVTSEY